jgi:hypothetical protein
MNLADATFALRHSTPGEIVPGTVGEIILETIGRDHLGMVGGIIRDGIPD